jgi:type I restriction enzyme, R subunit
MATGTGKTLTAAAVIKLFLRTGNARRVLFLVDRLELEDQAKKALTCCCPPTSRRSSTRRTATTGARRRSSSPPCSRCSSTTSTSALLPDRLRPGHLRRGPPLHRRQRPRGVRVLHRLQARPDRHPRDYLNFDAGKPQPARPARGSAACCSTPTAPSAARTASPPSATRCSTASRTATWSTPRWWTPAPRSPPSCSPIRASSSPSPTRRARTRGGLQAARVREALLLRPTNQLFCKTFLENALRDPVSGEIGKSIVFAVSQNHAAKLAQILNEMADRMFPGKYQSDFAVQVTSRSRRPAVHHQLRQQQPARLGNFIPAYKTSKARVCVTVGMMTTGYDCTDILNLGLFRPIFSPTDFIQIKGRGTRKHDFLRAALRRRLKEGVTPSPKDRPSSSSTSSPTASTSRRSSTTTRCSSCPRPKGQGGASGGGGGGPVHRGRHLRAPRRRHPPRSRRRRSATRA